MRQVFRTFPKIGQFRNAIKAVGCKAVGCKARFTGLDEHGKATYNNKPLPTLTYKGTVKLHGISTALIQTIEDGKVTIRTQSRSRFLKHGVTDNAGFAAWAHEKQLAIKHFFHPVNTQNIAVYGEWCGGNIKKGVGITGLDKMFVIFAVKLIDTDTWLTDADLVDVVEMNEAGIYHIEQFLTYKMKIDFENPQLSQNTLGELTGLVEQECPVAKQLGKEGIGEGIVWKCITTSYESSDFWFKVKGEKHSVSKVKTLAPVDAERLASINEFVVTTVTENRLLQAWGEVDHGEDRKGTGDFIRWVINDIFSEEADTMVASGFTNKDLGGPLSKAAKDWFFAKIDTLT